VINVDKKIKLSVRTLVEHVYKSGSIDNTFRSSRSLTEGTKIHQQIQKSYGKSDEKEVYVSGEILYEGLIYVVDGRCDGLLICDESVTVDEIKSTKSELSMINEDTYIVHWAQGIFYAYLYSLSKNLLKVNVQLTYVHVKSGETKRFKKELRKDELEDFVYKTIALYAPFAQLTHDHLEKRNESIQHLDFPFESYREGQRKLAGAAYKSILDKKQLFANAPTGIGKTISTTFPTIKAIGEGVISKFFYLTARTTTRAAAEEAFTLMMEKGLLMKVTTLTAKDKVCLKEETICTKDYCEYADGYFDRINGAMQDILQNESLMNQRTIETYAKKHKVCPFEFAIDLSYTSDAVICDYNYIFDPRVGLKRHSEEKKKQTALLVDEAHQLVDRGREMFSATVHQSLFQQLKKDYKDKNSNVYQIAKEINDFFNFFKKDCQTNNEFAFKEIQEELITLLDAFLPISEKALSTEGDRESSLLNAFFEAQNFIKVAALYNEQYVTITDDQNHDFTVKMFCLDPSHLLQQMKKNFRSTIFFSATFAPFQYYQEMLGLSAKDYAIAIDSPFRREQTEVFITPISTKYKDRHKTKSDIVKTIRKMVENNKGNYLVFFPSYRYMELVYNEFINEEVQCETIVQDYRMTHEERDKYLASFQTTNSTLIGFAVLGGVFSEGVDLKGDRLNGVIIVGVGLPQISLERDLIKDYFQKIGKNGYDFAYVYPGMNKVLQAGGRLIRTETDFGRICLIDDRFLTTKYVEMFPHDWKEYSLF
jgi:DNA excision repair protein ERCC-2